MWIEKLADGKFKYVERYKDPYSEKTKKKSVILTSDSAQASNKARKLLDKKINEAINEKKKSGSCSMMRLINGTKGIKSRLGIVLKWHITQQ